ncbi:dynamin family protein [Paenibacillus tarimensis]|uniref:dynamin family protein n=1 Tax=Paenibacillus tarimensis TaxID=416012 RepID=UPI001F454A77|nr:dynamin family protein [Paenibacillus tarimensis]MCF2942614.1 dynamin family protein [Paenibacillus tarimensis]
MDSKTLETLHPLDNALVTIRERMQKQNDPAHADKVAELLEKRTGDALIAAFCGHFSAGKSTLVNRLCGAELLPSSPIPTSANVVSIRGGEPSAVIERINNGTKETITAAPERLEEYCVNGEEFVSVAISYPSDLLREDLMLLDTPGIDSTDAAHRLATESALHLADVVFYVMDYNHVQSEINFTFAKQLTDWGKPMYLIVNQIDKHRDNELPFEEYKESVKRAFTDWHLEPAGILFLSLKKPDHPASQLVQLEALLRQLTSSKQQLQSYNIDASARFLIAEHVRQLASEAEPERQRLLEAAGGEEEAATVADRLKTFKLELEDAKRRPAKLQEALRQEVQAILGSANIMPAVVRDLAHEMLESRKPGFRTGILFAGAKTAAEQARRLEAFRRELDEQIQAAVYWHLKDLLRKAADKLRWRGDEVERQLQGNLDQEMTGDWLLAQIQSGAVMGNEYTMTYSRQVAQKVQEDARRRAYAFIELLGVKAAEQSLEEERQIEQQLAELGSKSQAVIELQAMDHKTEAYLQSLLAELPASPERPSLPVPDASNTIISYSPDQSSTHAVKSYESSDTAGSPAGQAKKDLGSAAIIAAGHLEAASNVSAPAANKEMLHTQHASARRLLEAASLLEGYEAMIDTVDAMKRKADRLKNGRFTIALFGAFSAGKSSFANALIGSPALPVSPNPTTAAINRIVAPEAEYPHGTAKVIMKSYETMLDDVRFSLSMLGGDTSSADISELLEQVKAFTPAGLHPGGRPHYSFLKAALHGWGSYGAQLGKELKASAKEYRQFVAEESRSCFVQQIDLHYDCPLTAQGIVLVDTPGADSVNARHTGVAFHYIKNADAVLFVTYYNHAFSQADRQFLTQLGRVKDQFELDKMFFIVNAADLADSSEELQGVLKHVEQNLLQHGIRFPRMFAVSSLLALTGKQEGNQELIRHSGIDAFEQSFLDFTAKELGGIAIEAARREITRAKDIVADWIESAGHDEQTRYTEAEALREAAAKALQHVQSAGSRAPFDPLRQELQELFHHVLQRVRYRFGEFFNFSFNPAVLQDDGRDLKKMLVSSWLELQQMLRKELSQELLATQLRLELSLKRLVQKHYESEAADTSRLLEGFRAEAYEPSDASAPEVYEEWQAREQPDIRWLSTRFKSPRHFFEGSGKSAMREELEQLLAPGMQDYMERRAEEWTGHYEQAWKSALAEVASRLERSIRSYESGRMASLNQSVSEVELRRLFDALSVV